MELLVRTLQISTSYGEAPAIVQGLASDKSVSVQPFLFGQFNGSLALTPETDVWVSETLKPEIISVPEKIIEKETVIREVIIEPQTPPTIQPPTNNANTVIITDPGLDLPETDPDDIIVIQPEPERPIIGGPSEPFKEISYPEPYPEFSGFEFDPWWSITPINFGVSFTFGATGYNPGNLFSNGGIFNESLWYPAVTEVSGVIQPEPIYESSIPTAVSPILLDAAASLDLDGGGGKGDLERYNYDRE